MLKIKSNSVKFFAGAFVALALAVAGQASAAVTFSSPIDTAQERMDVQTVLNMVVTPTPNLKVDGKFGPMTIGAVKAFQSMKGLTVDGKIGPMTRAALNSAQGTATTGGSTTPGCTAGAMYSSTTGMPCATTTGPVTLNGTFGTIATVTKLSTYNNEEIGEGQSGIKVLGVDVKASKDGDIGLDSTKLSFVISNTSGSTLLSHYVNSVSVWQGSTKIGSASASEFNKDSTGNYSKTISLSGASVKADTTQHYFVTIDAPSTLDSGDIDTEIVTIGMNNIRYHDGSGAITTDTDSGDLAISGVGISFVSYSTAANTKFKVLSDSSSPAAGIVIVDDTSTTDDTVLLKGKLKIEGTSNVTLNSLPVTLTATGATNIDALTGNITLVIGSNEWSESTGANCSSTCATNTTASVTFDNLDMVLTAGQTVNFEVKADINNVDAVSMDEGDTLLASFTSDNVSAVDAEDSQGSQLDDADKTGSLTGKAQEFRTQGIALSLVSTSATATTGSSNADDTGTFKITFKVTAVGENAYIATYTPLTYYPYTVDLAGTATTGGVSAVISNNTDTTLTTAYNWEINAGESETLTLTVSRVPYGTAAVGLYRAALTGVLWSSTDDNTPDNTYSSNLDSFKTDYISLN